MLSTYLDISCDINFITRLIQMLRTLINFHNLCLIDRNMFKLFIYKQAIKINDNHQPGSSCSKYD